MNRIISGCCAGLAVVFITSSIMSLDKPEVNMPPNYFEPHEVPSNYAVPQWHNNVAVASTATSDTVNVLGYNVF